MAFTSTLFKIQMPELTQSNFGENLAQQFRNIDSNFQKLANLGLTTGPAGEAAMWIPYNLNAVYCIPKITGGLAQDPHTDTEHLSSYYLDQAYVDQVEADYKKYYEITELGVRDYIYECALIYDALLAAIPNDLQDIIISDSVIYKRYWENDFTLDLDKLFMPGVTNNPYRERLLQCEYLRWGTSFTDVPDTPDIPDTPINAPRSGANTENIKKYVGQVKTNGWVRGLYTEFLPSDILVAGNIENYFDSSGIERKRFIPISTTAHIFIDPRFRNEISISGTLTSEQLEQLSIAVDQSCVLYGQAKPEVRGELVFNSVFAFPRIFVHDGEFYLSINGIDTNIPLTGRTGASGADANFFVVRLAPGSNTQPWGNNSPTDDGGTYTVGGRIGSNTETELIGNPDEELLAKMDNQPAFIFPAANYAGSQYKTTYWIGYLHRDGNSIKVYCGPENRVDTDLYEHVVGGTMMGLDIYEKSVASPTGNSPWWKPRGLMLPIGTRAVNDAQEYADFEYNDSSTPNPEVFGAHLIYSEKETGGQNNQKYQLHISSINDYRIIGKTSGAAGQAHKPNGVDAGAAPIELTKLFIDEPTFITHYGHTDGADHRSNKLLHVFGGTRIEGNLGDEFAGDRRWVTIAGTDCTKDANGIAWKFGSGVNVGNIKSVISLDVAGGAFNIKQEPGRDAEIAGAVVANDVGAEYIYGKNIGAENIASTNVYANRVMTRAGYRILLSNGCFTDAQYPIVLKLADGTPINFEYKEDSDGDNGRFVGTMVEDEVVADDIKPIKAGGGFLLATGQTLTRGLTWKVDGVISDFNPSKIKNAARPSTTESENYMKESAFPSWSGGVAGVVLVDSNEYVTVVRVLIAANGGVVEMAGSRRAYGIPINHSKSGTHSRKARFEEWKLSNNSIESLVKDSSGNAVHIPNPPSTMKQQWSESGTCVTYNGGSGWQEKSTDESYGAADVTCTLDRNGNLYISGADVATLFASTENQYGNNKRNEYIEFVFVYATPYGFYKPSDKKNAFILVDKNSSLINKSDPNNEYVVSGKDVATEPQALWYSAASRYDGLALKTHHDQTPDSEGRTWLYYYVDKDGSGEYDNGEPSQSSPGDVWYVLRVAWDDTRGNTVPGDGTFVNNNGTLQAGELITDANSKIVAKLSPIQYGSGEEPGPDPDPDPDPVTVESVAWYWRGGSNHDSAIEVQKHLRQIKILSTINELIISGHAMHRFDGPHGSVSLSIETVGGNVGGHLTIECWNSDFTQYFLEAYEIEYHTNPTDAPQQDPIWDNVGEATARKISVTKDIDINSQG